MHTALLSSSGLSTKDFIKKSVLESGVFQTSMTLENLTAILIALTASLLVGFYIYWIYKVTYRGVVYAQSLAMTLVGMTVLTCMVTLAISTNVILSLGMVGALSIVRYRTAVKEPFDLMFLFWAITSGISVGAHMYLLTCLGMAFVTLMVFALNARAVGGKLYIVVVRYTGDDVSDKIRRVMEGRKHHYRHRYEIKSKTMRGSDAELTMEVYVKGDNLVFAEKIRGIDNVKDLTIIQYNGEYHG